MRVRHKGRKRFASGLQKIGGYDHLCLSIKGPVRYEGYDSLYVARVTRPYTQGKSGA